MRKRSSTEAIKPRHHTINSTYVYLTHLVLSKQSFRRLPRFVQSPRSRATKKKESRKAPEAISSKLAPSLLPTPYAETDSSSPCSHVAVRRASRGESTAPKTAPAPHTSSYTVQRPRRHRTTPQAETPARYACPAPAVGRPIAKPTAHVRFWW